MFLQHPALMQGLMRVEAELGKNLDSWICCVAPDWKMRWIGNCCAGWTPADARGSPQATPELFLCCKAMLWALGWVLPHWHLPLSSSEGSWLFFWGLGSKICNSATVKVKTPQEIKQSLTCFWDEIKRFPRGWRVLCSLKHQFLK